MREKWGKRGREQGGQREKRGGGECLCSYVHVGTPHMVHMCIHRYMN